MILRRQFLDFSSCFRLCLRIQFLDKFLRNELGTDLALLAPQRKFLHEFFYHPLSSFVRDAEPTEEENSLTGKIIGAAIDVHRILGPGLLESAYEACLIYELRLRKLKSGKSKGFTCILQGCHA